MRKIGFFNFRKTVAKVVTGVKRKMFDGYYSQQSMIAPDMNTTDFLRSYGQIGWMFAAVNRIAQDVGSSEWKPYKGEIVQETSMALEILKHPNKFMSQYQFLWKSTAYLELTGKCYWYIAKDGLGRPRELWCLNPLDIWAVPDRDNFIKGYIYKSGAENIPLSVDEVIFIPLPDLINPYGGKGPAQAVASNLEIDKYTNTYIKNFFYNDARPGGIVNFPDMDPDEYDRAVEQYKDKHRGVENSSELLFTKGGSVTFTPIAMNIKDLDISALKDNNRDGILGAFGVPKSIVGITDDVNRSTAEAAEYTFAMHTIKPLLHLFQDVINNEFIPMFSEDALLRFTDPVPKNKDFVNTVITTRINKTMTINEARDIDNKMMGWNLPHIEGGDVIYQAVGMQPLGTPMPNMGVAVKPVDEAPPEEPTKGIKKKIYSKSIRKKIDRAIRKNNDTRHQEFLKMSEPLASDFQTIIQSYLKDMKKEVIQKVLDGSKDPVDIKKWNKDLQDKTVDLYVKCFNVGGKSVVQEFKSIENYIHKDIGMSFDIKDTAVKAKIQSKVSNITQVNIDTKQRIKDVISNAYDESNDDNEEFTINSIAEKIGAENFSEFCDSRCTTIAQTEVLSSLNQATNETYKQNSDLIDGKSWLASYSNTRESHLIASETYDEDNSIPVTDQFTVGDSTCDCPGDDSLPAEEVCNCGCCMMPIVNVN